MSSSVPESLHDLADRIPPADTIRARIAQKRQETQFLRRLLKIAVEAERTVCRQEGQHVQR